MLWIYGGGHHNIDDVLFECFVQTAKGVVVSIDKIDILDIFTYN